MPTTRRPALPMSAPGRPDGYARLSYSRTAAPKPRSLVNSLDDGPRCCSVDLAVHVVPEGPAELLLENLARWGEGQLVGELDASGGLVVGNRGFAMRADVLGGRGEAWPWDDDGVDAFAPGGVGHPDHRARRYRWVGAEGVSTSTEYTLAPPVMIMSLSPNATG
jgi:hypothetical protein